MAGAGTRKQAVGPEGPEDLRRLGLLKHTPLELLQHLYPLLEQRTVRARSTIRVAHDLPGRVVFIWSGRFRLAALAPSGVSITMAHRVAGDVFGHGLAVLGYERGSMAHLIADEAGVLLHLRADEFARLVKETPALCAAIMYDQAKSSMDAHARVYELVALSVRERLKAELVRLARGARRANGAWVIDKAPTHAALGAQIGATREAVSRHLNNLAQSGFIRLERGLIEIIQLERLHKLDGGDADPALFVPADVSDRDTEPS